MRPRREAAGWRPSLGAIPEAGGACFRVWAPVARSLDVVVAELAPGGSKPGQVHPLTAQRDGTFVGCVASVPVGGRYWYRLDEDRLLPDPASRYQPEGVHGPSALVDPSRFQWNDDAWPGLVEERAVVYELHVGTFTAEGTFAGVASRLDHLADLGVTAVELMPVAEFSGRWNWGYDGVDLFAPCHRYGTPDDLRALVDAAHSRGLGVILDVVYNHIGPEGAYLSAFSPHYFTNRHKSPWGDSINLDGPHSDHVRGFLIENALHWVHEYHVDGLRLDATHALEDDSREHFLSELSRHVEDEGVRPVVLIAEDERNLDTLIRPRGDSGFGLSGVWSDDFHHHLRRRLAGDSESYYASFSGGTADLAETIRRGWFFVGQRAAHTNKPRGSDPSGVPLHRFVFCLQNHDQVGNRALGDRLHHVIDLAVYRAASALLLLVPETPLLFMGQEWAASTPFLYFTDHDAELGRAVTAGRRAEFAAFRAFADAATRDTIPDPQEESTFARSRLTWSERDRPPHDGVLLLYRRLLALRRSLRTVTGDRPTADGDLLVGAPDQDSVVVRRLYVSGGTMLLVVRLSGSGRVEVSDGLARGEAWQTVLTTEDQAFAVDGRAPTVETEDRVAITFDGPAAVVLRHQ